MAGDIHAGKRAIIAGGGPAGLTAAFELLERTGVKPIVYESDRLLGGISKTINVNGNRIDIGGHRLFSKSENITQWWLRILPLQEAPAADELMKSARGGASPLTSRSPHPGPNPQRDDKVMLVRRRLSRIFFNRMFFDYPVLLSISTLSKLGFFRSSAIAFSYLKARLFPIGQETSLEDFFINRFGNKLYRIFFKDYTEKVWGISCAEINPQWGAQRVKGLSITTAVIHALKRAFKHDSTLTQGTTETSLIEHFLYPKFGPGQLWEEVGRLVLEKGGEIHTEHTVVGFSHENKTITAARIRDEKTGKIFEERGDFFFSSMPIRDLISSLGREVPAEIREIAEGLVYRDFITVGLLLRRLAVVDNKKRISSRIPDNWIYVQDTDVKLGRIQIYNNWSPYLVKDPDTIWLGLEYFCTEGDEFWNMPNDDLIGFAIDELIKLRFILSDDVIEGIVIRTPKAYPAYFGTYDRLHLVRDFLDGFSNLFLVGRNGMHRYNNQDHSMLTAIRAVENIIDGTTRKDNIWEINSEEEYLEQ